MRKLFEVTRLHQQLPQPQGLRQYFIYIRQQVLTRDDLPRMREAFMASTLREVHPVHAIDGAALPAAPGALTQDAASRIRAHIEQELGVSA